MYRLSGKRLRLRQIVPVALLSLASLYAYSVPEQRLSAREPAAFQASLETEPLSGEHTAARKPVRKRVLAAAPVPPSPRPRTLLPVVDQADIREEHKIIADEIFRLVPAACRNQLKNFYVRYDNPQQRGLAGKTSVIVSGNVTEAEFRALLIHEFFGHVIDLGCLEGHANSGISNFRDDTDVIYKDDPSVSFYQISWLTDKIQRADSHPNHYVTGYASWDAFEDFAETVTYYVLQEDAFRARAAKNPTLAKKLQWMETHLFTKQKTVARGLSNWDGKSVPWDATKLPYEWHAKQ